MFVGCALFAAPGFAAPKESRATETEQPAVAVQQVQLPLTGQHDEAAMVLIGTVLIGLGAAVRRAA
jgi:LPXTG-motif cell wall-anchored protein